MKLLVRHAFYVDDEPQLPSALKRAFRGEEYTVDTAGDGFAGLQKIKENQYDVIISDMNALIWMARNFDSSRATTPRLPENFG